MLSVKDLTIQHVRAWVISRSVLDCEQNQKSNFGFCDMVTDRGSWAF